VITNPPFAVRVDNAVSLPEYWRYGVTRHGEFDWLQYVVSRLAPGGRAAVLMPAGVGFWSGAGGQTRARMVQDGVIECVMALPQQLFALTAIRTQIWFLCPPRGRAEPVLFVDGSDLGSMTSRTRRTLSGDEIDKLVHAYVSWRQRGHADTPGLSRAVGPEEIADYDHQLQPALYVRHAPGDPSPAAAKNRLAELSEELERLHLQATVIDRLTEARLRRYGL
jgi:type I restriction enzyme M protein